MVGNISNFFNNLLTRSGITYLLLCLVLFSYSGQGGRYILFAFAFVIAVASNKKIIFDNFALLVMLFTASFSLIPLLSGRHPNLAFTIYFTICPVFFYLYGKIVMSEIDSSEKMLDIYLGIIISLCLIIFINLFVHNNFLYSPIAEQRVFFIGNSEEGIAATVIGVFISLCFVGVSLFFYCKTNLFRKISYLILSILALYTTTFLLNRSGIFITLVGFLIVSLYCSKKNVIRTIAIVAIAYGLYMFFVSMGWIDHSVITAYEERNEDLSTGGSRFERWGMAIDYLFDYPFGWSQHDGRYAHNMWLDVARSAGLIPMVLLFIITFRMIKDIWVICKFKPNNISILFLCLFACFMSSMLVEPVIENVPALFLIFLFLAGNIKEYRNRRMYNIITK